MNKASEARTSGAKTSGIFGTVIVLAAFVALLALGTWQVQRMVWKTDMLTAIHTGMAAEPTVFDNSATYDEYTRIMVEGRFDHAKEMYVYAINKNGLPGFYIYVPLHTDNNETIIINRGFVAPDFLDQATRAEGLPSGNVSLTGMLRNGAVKKYFIPENDITANRWFFADLAAMVDNIGQDRDTVYPMILELEADSAVTVPPYGGVTRVNIPNNHLGYAITWYGLALALLVVVFIYRKKTNRKQEEI
ncbi:MAG: SURF1 family protein [Sphingomonadales bacterium]|nr:SURF1 family protein [Sphingomonadales bacterium]